MKQCSKCKETKDYSNFYLRQGKWYNSWCRTCCNEQAKVIRKKYLVEGPAKAKKKAYEMWKKYKLSPEEYDSLLKSHGNSCAVCKKSPKKLCVDHCHKTGRVRGILCSKCNSALGFLEDDPQRVTELFHYLTK